MAITWGFYNSQNGDRKYSAEDFSKMFDGLISDGIFSTFGDAFVVTPYSGMTVKVGTGRAWFNHTWTLNDSSYISGMNFTKPTGVNSKRIDTIVIEVNTSTRTNTIKKITGSTTAPTLTKGAGGVYQYPIADIHLDGSMTVITQDRIVDRRGSADTPFVTGAVQSVSIEDLVKQWDAGFNTWFNGIKGSLDDDVGTHLTAAVDNAANHRNIFRGKCLGDAINEYTSVIRDGTFTDIYVGDYWEIEGVKWRVVDIDYWYRGCGSGVSATHHVLVMPDTPIIGQVAASENGPATTKGGFVGSTLGGHNILSDDSQDTKEAYKTSQVADVDNIPSEILDHFMIIREYLVNAVDETNGRPTSGTWCYTAFSVPSEIMMYGTRIWSYGNSGTIGLISGSYRCTDHLFTNSFTQLALFRLCPRYICTTSRYWLRDTVSTTEFALVLDGDGTANKALASSAYNIRPIFAICG